MGRRGVGAVRRARPGSRFGFPQTGPRDPRTGQRTPAKDGLYRSLDLCVGGAAVDGFLVGIIVAEMFRSHEP